VRHGGVAVPVAGALVTAQRAPAAATEPLTIDWSERGGQLSVRWNTAAASRATLTHVADGERTVLALQRPGGALVIDTSRLPAGGAFELSLSDGLNARLLTLPR
jgi:hypothetical protein